MFPSATCNRALRLLRGPPELGRAAPRGVPSDRGTAALPLAPVREPGAPGSTSRACSQGHEPSAVHGRPEPFSRRHRSCVLTEAVPKAACAGPRAPCSALRGCPHLPPRATSPALLLASSRVKLLHLTGEIRLPHYEIIVLTVFNLLQSFPGAVTTYRK